MPVIRVKKGNEWVEIPFGANGNNYNVIGNKPSINGVTLEGNKTAEDLGLGGVSETFVEARDAEVLESAKKYSDSKLVTIDIETRGPDSFWTKPLTKAKEIIDMVNDNKEVRLHFFDTITNTGDQLYTYETTVDGVPIFRRNVITKNEATRINIRVLWNGEVKFDKEPLTIEARMTNAVVPEGLTAEGNVQSVLDALNAKPSGGGGEKPWKLLVESEVTEPISSFEFTKDALGENISVKNLRIQVDGQFIDGGGNGYFLVTDDFGERVIVQNNVRFFTYAERGWNFGLGANILSDGFIEGLYISPNKSGASMEAGIMKPLTKNPITKITSFRVYTVSDQFAKGTILRAWGK